MWSSVKAALANYYKDCKLLIKLYTYNNVELRNDTGSKTHLPLFPELKEANNI